MSGPGLNHARRIPKPGLRGDLAALRLDPAGAVGRQSSHGRADPRHAGEGAALSGHAGRYGESDHGGYLRLLSEGLSTFPWDDGSLSVRCSFDGLRGFYLAR